MSFSLGAPAAVCEGAMLATSTLGLSITLGTKSFSAILGALVLLASLCGASMKS